MKINASEVRPSDKWGLFPDKKWRWAKLEDGTIENLYYSDVCEEMIPEDERSFYYNEDPEEGDIGWYLDHDRFFKGGFALYHSKILEFGEKKEDLL